MSSLTPDQIKTLEQSRQRLVQLTHSLASLITSLNQSDPLPSWTSLQSQATIISNNLLTISDHLSDNRDLLSTLVAYPAPSYPSRNPANTVALEQLLRTKLDPRVEDWVARGRKAGGSLASASASASSSSSPPFVPGNGYAVGTGVAAAAGGEHGTGKGLDDLAALAELWDWAPVEANLEARRRNWGGNFTLEERERGVGNVVTGLRRVLEDDDDDDSESGSEEEEDSGEEEGEGEPDEMEVVGVRRKSGVGQGLEFDIAPVSAAAAAAGPGNAGQQKVVAPVVPLDEILRFMTVGIMPSQR